MSSLRAVFEYVGTQDVNFHREHNDVNFEFQSFYSCTINFAITGLNEYNNGKKVSLVEVNQAI